MQTSIENLIHQIKATRKEHGLSQRDLSRLSGIPQSHISKIENGNVNITLSSLIELTRALGLEITLTSIQKTSSLQTEARIASQVGMTDQHISSSELSPIEKLRIAREKLEQRYSEREKTKRTEKQSIRFTPDEDA